MNNISKEDFERLIGSWLGCDGGNPDARVWICGIEHGGGFDDIKELVTEKSLKSIEEAFWDKEFREKNPKYSTWPYNQKVAKLMLAINQYCYSSNGQPICLDGYKEYMENMLYTKSGDSFKLNLFPFSSPSVSDSRWRDSYTIESLCGNRDEYRKLCSQKRFVEFSKLRDERKPKVIIGTGITQSDNFLKAFGFRQYQKSEQWELSHNRKCHVYKDDSGALVVSPFFGGRYGMNRDRLLIELAEKVVALL